MLGSEVYLEEMENEVEMFTFEFDLAKHRKESKEALHDASPDREMKIHALTLVTWKHVHENETNSTD